MRLDRALHARGLARSRSHAQELISAGVVTVDGAVVQRASAQVADDATLSVAAGAHYVSRAAHKLIGALDACAPLGLSVTGAHALDAGASTGGFTQVLLERGVARVDAVDVGHDQLASTLRDDARVTATEGLNVRDLAPGGPGSGASLVVADLSFISLRLVIPALVSTADALADFVLMVKPQFEVGRGALSARGVVTDDRARARAVADVAAAMQDAGLTIHHVARSALPGPQGNVEFFVWASGSWQASGERAGSPVLGGDALTNAIDREVKGSP
ncbi:TlyA family RNA methyltransferase [Demequina sp. NBRC 110056]|uniref:TlyA family RNA methyltransferase n=1 Tax=Demequina sp. NBRC 110056 TaxID=1570345 RepID=UPI0009FE2B7C|nr:TlyA family RNA methyltransferase [Demequina sp. NBRC 110056]